jgi:hypothetical protein
MHKTAKNTLCINKIGETTACGPGVTVCQRDGALPNLLKYYVGGAPDTALWFNDDFGRVRLFSRLMLIFLLLLLIYYLYSIMIYVFHSSVQCMY